MSGTVLQRCPQLFIGLSSSLALVQANPIVSHPELRGKNSVFLIGFNIEN